MCFFFPPPRKRRYPASAFEDPRPRKRRVTYQQLPHTAAGGAGAAHARYEPLRGHGVKRDPPSSSHHHHYHHHHTANGDGVVDTGALRGRGARRAPLDSSSTSPSMIMPGSGRKMKHAPDVKVRFAMSVPVPTDVPRVVRAGAHVRPRKPSTASSSYSGRNAAPTSINGSVHAPLQPQQRRVKDRNHSARYFNNNHHDQSQFHDQHYRSSLSAAAAAAAATTPGYMAMAQAPVYDYSVPASYYLDLFAVREATSNALRAAGPVSGSYVGTASGASSVGSRQIRQQQQQRYGRNQQYQYTARPKDDRHHLRRQPAYHTLRYNV